MRRKIKHPICPRCDDPIPGAGVLQEFAPYAGDALCAPCDAALHSATVPPEPEADDETCDECRRASGNVGPWEDGRRLCGGCKVRVTLARPGARQRLEADIRTAIKHAVSDA